MDSNSESEFGFGNTSPRGIGPLPKPNRPKVILPSEGNVPESLHKSSFRSERQKPTETVQLPDDSPAESGDDRLLGVAHSEAGASSKPPVAGSTGGSGGLYFLLTCAAFMSGLWFIGPKLVEEYHYAAEVGRSRALYENAVTQLERQPLNNVSHAYQLVAQRIRPSVVSVSAIKSIRDGSGLGSGVIMSEDGYIMTNAHVLEGATRFLIELHDRRRFEAKLIGTDSTSDLALLKISAPNLVPATWGDSESVNVGSIVWAIGSPYGFQQTVTSGIVSGKDRPGDPNHQKQSLIQTDAAVNPGNSGGPLVDAQGHVIGINTSIFGETFQGISFAVPSETARFVFKQLLQTGKVTRGYLGVLPEQVNHHDAVRMELPDLDGAKLRSVLSGSPADLAGIRRGDVIRSWNGNEVKEFKSLFRFAEMTEPNTPVKVSLFRDGEERITEVIVGAVPDQARWRLQLQTPQIYGQ